MDSKRLVERVLQGLDTPGVAVGPLAVHYCAGLAGFTLRDYSTKPQALADSVLRYYDQFRPDAVWVSADTWVSAQAMGAKVGATDEHQPLGGVGPSLVKTAADIDRIRPPDVSSQGRYPLMLEALGRVADAIGREAFVVACFDQYPFSLAAALMGINEIMLRAVDDPEFVKALMARCAEYAVAYGRALVAAGADMLSGGDSPAVLLGPELYSRLALPFEQQVITSLQKSGKRVSLHICGNTRPILDRMARSGADVLEVDHQVDLAQACRIAGANVTLWGNLDPVRVLERGGPLEVESAARQAIEAVRSAGHRRFVLSSGCTLAVGTPKPNLEALQRVARSSCLAAQSTRLKP